MFQFLIVIPNAEEIHEQPERLMALIVLHLGANAHQGFTDFVEGFAPTLIGLNVALLAEVLELARNGLRGGEKFLGDLFDRNGAFATAQILDNLALQRR